MYYQVFLSPVQFEDDHGYEVALATGINFPLWGQALEFELRNNLNLALSNTDRYFLEGYVGWFPHETSAFFVTYADDPKSFDGGKNIVFTFDQSLAVGQSSEVGLQLGFADMFQSITGDSDYLWWSFEWIYSYEQWQWGFNYQDTDVRKAVDSADIAQASLSLVLRLNID